MMAKDLASQVVLQFLVRVLALGGGLVLVESMQRLVDPADITGLGIARSTGVKLHSQSIGLADSLT